jgi:hypothetical protein
LWRKEKKEMAMTDEEIRNWITDQQREYAAGTLAKSRIRRLERIPGWEWGCEPGPLTPTAKVEDLLMRSAALA